MGDPEETCGDPRWGVQEIQRDPGKDVQEINREIWDGGFRVDTERSMRDTGRYGETHEGTGR
jgi:hypothetical protein